MLFQGHYQNAYVTHDLDKAMGLAGRRFGVTDFLVFDPEMAVRTPDGDRPQSIRCAMGWSGGLQIELIQPVSGHVGPYRDVLPADPADFTPRFHHIAVRRDDLGAMREEIERLGFPLAFEGEVPGLVFVYLDAREALGHYLGFVWAGPQNWQGLGWPPGKPVL